MRLVQHIYFTLISYNNNYGELIACYADNQLISTGRLPGFGSRLRCCNAHCLQISIYWSMFNNMSRSMVKWHKYSKETSSTDVKQSSWLRLYHDLSFYVNPFKRYHDDCNTRFHTWFVYHTYCQPLYWSVNIFAIATPTNLRCSWSSSLTNNLYWYTGNAYKQEGLSFQQI